VSRWKNRPLRARVGFALQGIVHAFTSEASLRVQALLAGLALLALIALRPAPLWWALFSLAGAAVLAAELFNTALEQLADQLADARTEGIRIAKDCAAGAVLVSALGALAVGVAFVVHVIRN
jgi:undecaprenol kinase